MAKFINPLKFGLLGGLGKGLEELDKFNFQRVASENIQARQAARYQAMLDANLARIKAQNDAMITRLNTDKSQRTHTYDTTDNNGQAVRITYENVPDGKGGWDRHELGRVPLSAEKGGKTGGGGYTLGAGQVRYNADGSVAATGPDRPDTQGAIATRQKALQDEINKRADQRDKRMRDTQADRDTKADMKEFDNATPDKQRTLAESAGVPYMVDDPKGGTHRKSLFDSTQEADQVVNPNLRKAYQDAVSKQNRSIGNGPDTTTPSGQPADMSKHGQPIRYDAQGNAYIKGPDGKPVPYNPQSDTSPLAMDNVAQAEPPAMPDETETDDNPGEEGYEQSPLIAGNEAPEEQMPPPPDEEDEGGLIGGGDGGQFS